MVPHLKEIWLHMVKKGKELLPDCATMYHPNLPTCLNEPLKTKQRSVTSHIQQLNVKIHCGLLAESPLSELLAVALCSSLAVSSLKELTITTQFPKKKIAYEANRVLNGSHTLSMLLEAWYLLVDINPPALVHLGYCLVLTMEDMPPAILPQANLPSVCASVDIKFKV